MSARTQIYWLSAIVVVAGVGLHLGWRQFWFLTDDALIAFRYASNSMLGHGYVWNAPPFRPVEGYTSFLWVVLLDIIWRWFNIEPPNVANYLALLFSYLSLLLTVWMVQRLALQERLARYRSVLLTLVLLGMLTNRTFLAWTSSGLETALFNCCFLVWIATAVFARKRDGIWLSGLTLTAALLHLTRPDGLLILLSTATLVIHRLWALRREGEPDRRILIGLAPMLIPVVHLAWRRITYGEWLPNTYYAKYISPWPEAGVRYLASFILEYGLWFWLGLLAWVAIRYALTLKARSTEDSAKGALSDVWRGASEAGRRRFGLIVVAGTIAAHVAYYTLVIGGDHFEYRVFSYLIPLIFVSAVWLLNRLTSDGLVAVCGLALFLIVSWPVQWTHYLITKDRTTRDSTWIMRVPIAPQFPAGLKWYARAFDGLQSWLIERHVCMRHQEHKIFYEFLSSRFPERSLSVPPLAGEFPIAGFQSVGVPGWVFPRVAILDAWGLNDYVIARHKERPHRIRYMAHDRFPPQGYLESFSLNYGMLANQSTGFIRREIEMTAEEIKTTEQFWIDRIVHGLDRPFSYPMLNRIGESLRRTSKPDSAVFYLRQAVTLDSLAARAYVNLSECFEAEGLDDSALIYAQKAFSLEPANPMVACRLGRAYAATGYDLYHNDSAGGAAALAQAETYLSQTLQIDSARAEALVELASINLFLDRVDSSVVYLARLENQAYPSPGELDLLGSRYAFKQRRDLAVRAYRLAIRNGLNVILAKSLSDRYIELSAGSGQPAR